MKGDERDGWMNIAALAMTATLLAGAGAPAADPPSIRAIVRELPGDFRRVASRESLIELGAAGALALAVHGHDASITRDAVNSRTLDRATEPGSAIGSGYVNVGGAFATYLAGRMFDRPDVQAVGADLLGAQLVSGVITQGIKVSVRRTRPNGGHYSFPSGHTSATFATASVLQRHFGWKVGIPAYALGAYVAAARLQENQHYLSDVVFGAAIGAMAGRVITIHTPAGRMVVSATVLRRGAALVIAPVSVR